MKKFNLITIFASLAIVAASFIGCTSEYDSDIKYLDALKPIYIIGDFTPEVNLDTSKYPVTSIGLGGDFAALDWSGSEGTISFTYNNKMNAWGGGNGTLNFKVTDIAGWTLPPYGLSSDTKGTVKIDGDYVDLFQSGGSENITVEGFEPDTQYTIYVKGSKTKVSVKVVKG